MRGKIDVQRQQKHMFEDTRKAVKYNRQLLFIVNFEAFSTGAFFPRKYM